MKKFEFRLQRLLTIREAEERRIQNELAGILNIQNTLKFRRDEYQQKIFKERDAFSRKMGKEGISFSELEMFGRFIDGAHRVIRNSERRIEEMEPDIEKVRERLVEASKERRVVEMLKEKRWKEYLYDLNREMIKEGDDMNQKIYLQRMKENSFEAIQEVSDIQ